MNVWQGAWHIAKHELQRDKFGLVFTLLFCLYISILTTGVYDFNGESLGVTTWALDLIFVITFPSLAFVMSRTTFRMWREDTISGKLAQWRALPIPLNHLTLGRLIQLVIVLTPVMIIFFTTQYVMMANMREAVSLAVYVEHGLFWYCYALGMAVMYVYWEVGFSGKYYSLFCYSVIPVLGVVIVILKLAGVSIVQGILNELQAGHWWYTAAAAVFCIISMAAGYTAIVKRLGKRSY